MLRRHNDMRDLIAWILLQDECSIIAVPTLTTNNSRRTRLF